MPLIKICFFKSNKIFPRSIKKHSW